MLSLAIANLFMFFNVNGFNNNNNKKARLTLSSFSSSLSSFNKDLRQKQNEEKAQDNFK